MSGYEPGRAFADEAGAYATAHGGEPLTCNTCGQLVGVQLDDGLDGTFTTDGVTTLHWRPECDPDWKRWAKPSRLTRLRRWVTRRRPA